MHDLRLAMQILHDMVSQCYVVSVSVPVASVVTTVHKDQASNTRWPEIQPLVS